MMSIDQKVCSDEQHSEANRDFVANTPIILSRDEAFMLSKMFHIDYIAGRSIILSDDEVYALSRMKKLTFGIQPEIYRIFDVYYESDYSEMTICNNENERCYFAVGRKINDINYRGSANEHQLFGSVLYVTEFEKAKQILESEKVDILCDRKCVKQCVFSTKNFDNGRIHRGVCENYLIHTQPMNPSLDPKIKTPFATCYGKCVFVINCIDNGYFATSKKGIASAFFSHNVRETYIDSLNQKRKNEHKISNGNAISDLTLESKADDPYIKPYGVACIDMSDEYCDDIKKLAQAKNIEYYGNVDCEETLYSNMKTK